MSYKSSRHHYIPEFLIRGFTNEDGKVFLFDRRQDKILTKERPPKSVFWEKDRNTMKVGDFKTSIIEEATYQPIDNGGSEAIKFLRNVNLKNDEIPITYAYKLDIFLLNLFWRIPNSDKAYDLIYDILNYDLPEKDKQKEWLKKHQKPIIFKHSINQVQENNSEVLHEFRFVEFDRESFILSDNPTLYEREPEKHIDLDNFQYLFPISGKRGFIKSIKGNIEEFKRLERKHALVYNFLSIAQCKRYAVSGDFELLKKSVELFRNFQSQQKVIDYREYLFQKLFEEE